MNDNSTINSLVGRDIPQVSLDELIYGGYTSSSFKSPYETKAKNIAKTVQDLTALEAQGKLTARGKTKLMLAQSKYDNALKDLEVDIQSRYGRFDAKRKSKQAKDLKGKFNTWIKDKAKNTYHSESLNDPLVQDGIRSLKDQFNADPFPESEWNDRWGRIEHKLSFLGRIYPKIVPDTINKLSKNIDTQLKHLQTNVIDGKLPFTNVSLGNRLFGLLQEITHLPIGGKFDPSAEEFIKMKSEQKGSAITKDFYNRYITSKNAYKDQVIPSIDNQNLISEEAIDEFEKLYETFKGTTHREGWHKVAPKADSPDMTLKFIDRINVLGDFIYGKHFLSEGEIQVASKRRDMAKNIIKSEYSDVGDKRPEQKVIDDYTNNKLDDDSLVEKLGELGYRRKPVQEILHSFGDLEQLSTSNRGGRLPSKLDQGDVVNEFFSIPNRIIRDYPSIGKIRPFTTNEIEEIKEHLNKYLNTPVGEAMIFGSEAATAIEAMVLGNRGVDISQYAPEAMKHHYKIMADLFAENVTRHYNGQTVNMKLLDQSIADMEKESKSWNISLQDFRSPGISEQEKEAIKNLKERKAGFMKEYFVPFAKMYFTQVFLDSFPKGK